MAIGIRSAFEYDWAGSVYKSACNDIEQQTQPQGFSPIGQAWHAEQIKKCDIVTAPEQILKANFYTFSCAKFHCACLYSSIYSNGSQGY